MFSNLKEYKNLIYALSKVYANTPVNMPHMRDRLKFWLESGG